MEATIERGNMGKESGKRRLHYHNFILSVWQDNNSLSSAQPVWRFSLENPHTGERTGFTSTHELMCYLQHWTQDTSALSAQGIGDGQ